MAGFNHPLTEAIAIQDERIKRLKEVRDKCSNKEGMQQEIKARKSAEEFSNKMRLEQKKRGQVYKQYMKEFNHKVDVKL